jgi:thioesterase domain-containing protein
MTSIHAPEETRDERAPDRVSLLLSLKFRKKGPLVELKKADEGVPVYFIHELTGDVACYHRIVEAIEGPAFGIQVPQLERRTSNISTVEKLAAKYVELISGKHPDGPVRIVGYSAGSTVALEVANQLTSIGRQPQILVNIDQPIDNSKGIISPRNSFLENLYCWLRDEPKWPLSKFGARLMEKIAEAFTAKMGRSPREIVREPAPAQNITWLRILADKASTPEEGDFIKKFYEILFAYIPPRLYSGQVLSFIATENKEPDRLVKSWRSVAQASEFIVVRGDHETLLRGPGVIEIREHIRNAFARLPTTSTPAAQEPERAARRARA